MDPIARQVVTIRIEDEMRSSYLDYSMSVIIGRALPDVRDGLKPVHRRILYAMHQMGMGAGKRYTKCAGVVGEVLKKLHPHGDSAVYDALVRMAQPWNLRYLLVDGQGNFGSVDGDPAAAYRYTECRMTKMAEEMLVDIQRDTVDFVPNFDGSDSEPVVLPSRLPNLLVNGADGIAVGMATKIPPHNLTEIIDACVELIDNPGISLPELMAIVPGPDFPTAGAIYGRSGILDAYETGRGRVIVRGNCQFEEQSDGSTHIVIDELPYQVNKARLLEQVADLVKERRLEGIRALRDESDRHGMRIVIELKRDAFPEVVVNHLYKHTPLQSTFGVIMLAIVDNQPRILSLREMLQLYIGHRREVVLRRTRHLLQKAKDRAHILEGLVRALDVIDEIITLIRHSSTTAEARERMIERFEFTEVQASAILEMRLQRLTGMERDKVLAELEEVRATIAELEEILGSELRLMGVVKEELIEVRDAYGDVRRTRILDARGELSMHDLVAEEDQVVTLSHLGYIKRCRPDEWRMQRRGGFGTKGMSTREEDYVSSLFVANTHSLLLVFTTGGKVFPLPVYELPEAGRVAKGRPIINLVPMPKDERVAAVVSVRDLGDEVSLIFVSRQGLVKRTPLEAFKNLRQGGMIACGVGDDDELVVVQAFPSDDPGNAMLFTRLGKCIRFSLDDVPTFGRSARGNRGIRMGEDDVVVDALLVPSVDMDADDDDEDVEEVEVEVEEEAEIGDDELDLETEEAWPTTLLTVSSLGYGKRTPFDQYRRQGRYGKGILSFRTGDRIGEVVAAREVRPDDGLLLVTNTGRVIRFSAGEVRLVKTRASIGVRLMRLEPGEQVVDIASMQMDDDDEVEGAEGAEGAEAASEAATDASTAPAEDGDGSPADDGEAGGDDEADR